MKHCFLRIPARLVISVGRCSTSSSSLYSVFPSLPSTSLQAAVRTWQALLVLADAVLRHLIAAPILAASVVFVPILCLYDGSHYDKETRLAAHKDARGNFLEVYREILRRRRNNCTYKRNVISASTLSGISNNLVREFLMVYLAITLAELIVPKATEIILWRFHLLLTNDTPAPSTGPFALG